MIHILYIGLAIMSMPLLANNDVAQPKSYNIEQFLNASEEELRTHKQKLDELEKKGKLNITPSQYPFFYPDPIKNRREMVRNVPAEHSESNWKPGNILFKPNQIITLNKAMATEEKIYARGGATVYHAINPRLYAQTYIRTKTDNLIRELQGQPVTPSKFLLFRDWRPDYDTEKQKRKEYLSSGSPRDTDPKVAANLMACSVGLSSSEEGESAIQFWLRKRNIRINKSQPIQIFDQYQYAPELKNLDTTLEAETDALYNKLNTGILLQLEVKDKRMLNKIMYISKPFGFKRNLKIRLQNNESITIDTPQDLIQTMMHKPSSFPKKEHILNRELQTRIVLTGDLMLDPTNPKVRANVALNAYADNQEALDKFHTKVDAYFKKKKDQIQADYQMRYNKMNLPQKFWHNLQTRLCTPSSYAERRMLRKEGGNLFIRGNTFSGE